MRILPRTTLTRLIVCLLIGWTIIGCRRRDEEPGASTTTPPATSAVTSEPGLEAEEPGLAELPEEEPVAPAADPGVAEEVTEVEEPEVPEPAETAPPVAMGNLVPIEIELPAPAFRGTPVPLEEPNVEKPLGKPRGPFLAPEGTINLAGGTLVTCSDPAPASGEVDFITDGDKEASDFGYLELRPGTEWVQVDLGQRATVYAVLLWHNHAEARVYRDVVVQVSDDPDFLDAQTVFNNDYDNSSGMGIGSDRGYVETSEGKLIDCKGVEGRYVRFYSKGSHVDDKNHYTEVEVFGRPAT